MRIALIGLGPFGAKVAEALLERGDEVVAIYTSPVKGKALPLMEVAENRGIPLLQPERMRDEVIREGFKKLDVEIGVMAFVTDIVPLDILQHPTHGFIQYHPSLLPRHRGSSSINWAIIQGESRTGLSIFWPDEGLDTGPVLLQKEVDISPDDTVGSLYFNQLFPMGVDAMIESVELVQNGKAPRIPQDESLSTYESPCEEEHGMIDWTQPVSEVYNRIRGCNPQPGATTSWNGTKLKIYDSARLDSSKAGNPGEIVEITDDGFVVLGHGGSILVKRVQPEGSAKIATQDFAKDVGLDVGTRLG